MQGQKYVRVKSKHFNNYEDASAHHKSELTHCGPSGKVRIRKRVEGFDVVVFTKAAKEAPNG
jgi:putative transposon-encoded protein